MAPKAKAPVQSPQPTKVKAPATGLQLSAAQWKAYYTAYNATATAAYRNLAAAQRRAALQAAALSLRKYRLNAAYGMAKKTAAAHTAAQTAAIALFAVSMTRRQAKLAHQNRALQDRIYADFERHVLTAGRLQYAYQGEKVFAHATAMRTLTTAQALAIENARFAAASKAAKTAKTAVASTRKAPSAATLQIQSAARAAGLAAAKSLPGPQLTASQKASRTASATARSTASRTASQTAHNTASATAKATIAARKKGVAKVAAAPRTAPRPPELAPGLFVPRAYGDPAGYDCVAAALANHLLYATGYRIGRRAYYALADALGEAPTIEQALKQVMSSPPWDWLNGPVLAAYVPVVYPLAAPRKLVVGVCSPAGAHAAVALETGSLVTWGEILPAAEVCVPGTAAEEAWDLLWVLPRSRPLDCRLPL